MKIKRNFSNIDVTQWVTSVNLDDAPVCAPVALLQLVAIAGYYASLCLATATQPDTSSMFQLRNLGS